MGEMYEDSLTIAETTQDIFDDEVTATKTSDETIKPQLKVCSWNIGGGLRNLANRQGGLKFQMQALNASIICFQETKLAGKKALTEDLALVEGFTSYFSFCTTRAGFNGAYSGVASYVSRDIVCLAAEDSLGCCACRSKDPVHPSISSCPFACDIFLPKWESAVLAGEALGGVQDDDAYHNASEPQTLLKQIDAEGRCLMTDHGDFVLINVYAPCNRPDDPVRLASKRAFNVALRSRCEALVESGREVILLGDMNAASQRIDYGDPPSKEEWDSKMTVQWMKTLLGPRPSVFLQQQHDNEEGINHDAEGSRVAAAVGVSKPPLFLDTFRIKHPTREHAYTCWSNKTGARSTNFGCRIDCILATPGLCQGQERGENGVGKGDLVDADILPSVMGSDHCPCWAAFSNLSRCFYPPDLSPRPPLPPLCTANHPDYLKKQTSVKSFFPQKPAMAAAPSPPGAAWSRPSPSSASSLPPPSFLSSSPILARSSSSAAAATSKSKKRGKKSQQMVAGKGKQQKLYGFLINMTSTTVTDMVVEEEVVDVDRECEKEQEKKAGEMLQQPEAVGEGGGGKGGGRDAHEEKGGRDEADEINMLLDSVPSTSLLPESQQSEQQQQQQQTSSSNGKSSKSSWAEIFKPPPVPKCSGHQEPCRLHPVKDTSSENYGRSFYCCTRASGSDGDQSARCKFFLWQDEWKGGGLFQRNRGWRGGGSSSGRGGGAAKNTGGKRR